MSDEGKYYIPRYLDEPTRIILWSVDEFIGFFLPFLVLFLYFNSPIMAVMVGIIMVLALKKIKGEHGHYFILNIIYWYLPKIIKFKHTPPSHLRNFIG